MKRDHILIIEDERAIRESVQDLLELNNYRVSVAGDGKAGLEALKDDMPDLILSDVRMPGMGSNCSENSETTRIRNWSRLFY